MKVTDQSLKQCNETELLKMLREIQVRLGSVAERVDDLGCARMIAHRLNNLRTASMFAPGCRRTVGEESEIA